MEPDNDTKNWLILFEVSVLPMCDILSTLALTHGSNISFLKKVPHC